MATIKGREHSAALALAIAVNAIIFLYFSQPQSADAQPWIRELGGLTRLLPAGAGLFFIGVINAQLRPTDKERLVFLRWHDPLPGSRAFSHYALNDPRVDYDRLLALIGYEPVDPSKQNAVWYRLYDGQRKDDAIEGLSKGYLLYRDYAALSALAVPLLGALSIWLMAPLYMALGYCGILVAQYLLASRAARDRGTRLVTTVLARASASN